MMVMQGRKINAIRHNLEQGSSNWLEFRQKHIMASDAAPMLGISPWRTREQLLNEKLGQIPPQEVNNAMQRGMLLESKGRACAEEELGTLFLPEVLQSIEYPWMCASYDGICIDNKMIIEIKCTNAKNHAMAKNGKIPDYYMPQIQHQIVVCDLDCCHYYSFDGNSGVVVVVERDSEFIKRMIDIEYEFYQEMKLFGLSLKRSRRSVV